MEMRNYKFYLTNIGLFYVAAIWGSTFFVVKDSLAHINPVVLVGYRFTLAAFMLACFLIYTRRPLFVNMKSGLILGALLWLVYGPQTIGLGLTTASNSGFITGLFVAFVPIFSFLFLREPPSGSKILAILVSVAGLWFLMGGFQEVNRGDLLTIITAIAYAAYILFADKYVKASIDPYVLSFQQFLGVGLISLGLGAVLGLPFTPATMNTFGIIFFLTLFPTLSAFVIQLVAQKRVTPIKISLVFALEPVFAAIFAWTLGGETFILSRASGGFLIFAALIIAELSGQDIKNFFNISVGRIQYGGQVKQS